MTTSYTQTRGRARIGVLVPVSNTNMEPDMAMLAPPGVSIHVARAGGYDVDAIPDAAQMRAYSDTPADETVEGLRLCGADVILYGCTSATLAQGPDYDARFRRGIEAKAGVPAVTAAGALVAALRALGIRRFAFASPYVAPLNDLAVGFIEAFGPRCVGRFDTPRPLGNPEVAKITPEEAIGFADAADCAEAEAIVLSCTDMRAAEAVPEIERRLGKPAVTSNQAILWAGLGRLGVALAGSPLAGHRLARAALPAA